MTRPNHIHYGRGPIYAYADGFLYCSTCGEWIHETEEHKVKRSKGIGRLLCRRHGHPLRSSPTNSEYKIRFREKVGVKRID